MINGRRQPSCGGTSRMTRECQVRFCERLGVKFPGPTRHFRQIGMLLTVTACPLRSRSGQTRACFANVRFVRQCCKSPAWAAIPKSQEATFTWGNERPSGGERSPQCGRPFDPRNAANAAASRFNREHEPWRYSVHRAQLQRDCHHLVARDGSRGIIATSRIRQQIKGSPDGLL